MSEETITITKKEYRFLKKDSAMLTALENGGVENWEWYGESLLEFWEAEDEGEFDD